jgi:hypothetical protein
LNGFSVLLLACYELGHQPLSLAWPLAFLKRAGFDARALDLSVQSLTDADIAHADFIGLAAPMHTALRLATLTARRVRALNPHAHLCFYGLYAQLNAALLFEQGLADSVIAGEAEGALVELVRALAIGEDWRSVPGVSSAASRVNPSLARLPFPAPERTSLPALTHYAHYRNGGDPQPAGYVEASRGCLHTCAHCPITPVYGGRFFVVPAGVVLADIEQQVEMGAQHITFGDPDFLNGPKHALALARELHRRWPRVTFDFTTKVEHILQHRTLFSEFSELGSTFVVSAIESVSDRVLSQLRKGHTAADIDTALATLDSAGIALQPTLVAFTPWTALDDYVAQLEWICARGLIGHIPPVQLSIRLLLPPGSPLLAAPDAGEWLRDLDSANFTYRWQHPDPRMEALYARVTACVVEAERCGEDPATTFESIRALPYAVAGMPAPVWQPTPQRARPPRLTEHWFC